MTPEPKTFRVLVTGSRIIDGHGRAKVHAVLARICAPILDQGHPVVIVQGECSYGEGGVDRAARDWAEQTAGVQSEGHPADWRAIGKAAGPRRNAHMVSLGADICVAFPAPGSRGTWDCLQKAADAGIPGRVYPLGVRHA